MNTKEHRVLIDDTTLRDGEQSPGVFLTLEEKVETARRLDSFGVDQIEAGTPAMGKEEQEAIRAIATAGLHAEVFAWCRAVESDIDAACECKVRNLHVSLPVSEIQIRSKLGKSPDWVLSRLREILLYAGDKVEYVSVGAEDASRADSEFLFRFMDEAARYGAGRFRYCDTVGILDPFRTFAVLAKITTETSLPVEFHAHNDFGMATANTLAAVKAGVKSVNVTVNGLGERTGNAPLEEVTMALKHIEGYDIQCDMKELLPLCRYVAGISGRTIPTWKPITGSGIFAHESGIHADGVMKNPENYEPFLPEETGHERVLPLGKHSGSHIVRHHLNRLSIFPSDQETHGVLAEVRLFSMRNKRPPKDDELCAIYERLLAGERAETPSFSL